MVGNHLPAPGFSPTPNNLAPSHPTGPFICMVPTLVESFSYSLQFLPQGAPRSRPGQDPSTSIPHQSIPNVPFISVRCSHHRDIHQERETCTLVFKSEDGVGGRWVAQWVKHLPSAQVMIPGSWDRAPRQTLLSREPASPSPSAPPHAHVLLLSNKINQLINQQF